MLGYSTFNPQELVQQVNSVAKTFLFKLETVFPKDLRGNKKSKIQIEQKVQLQAVQFCGAYATHFGIVGVLMTPAFQWVIHEWILIYAANYIKKLNQTMNATKEDVVTEKKKLHGVHKNIAASNLVMW